MTWDYRRAFMRDEDVAVIQQALLDIAKHVEESNRQMARAVSELHDIRRAVEEIGVER